MKKLFIILLLVPAMCWGQNKDSIKLKWADASKAHRDTMVITKFIRPTTGQPAIQIGYTLKKDSLSDYIVHGSPTQLAQYWISGKPRYDTPKILMLVCDTSFIPNTTSIVYLSQINGFTDTIGYIPNRIPYTWWQFGYEVCWMGGVVGGDGTFYCHKIYLDKDKQPLPQNIVVWMTKEIKQQP